MIELKGVSKSWARKGTNLLAVSNFSMSILRGEFVSLVGPSGCGKTTILRLIAGLLQPTRGSVSVYKTNMQRNKKLSIIFQKPALLPWRTIYENIRLPIEIDGRISESQVTKKIKLVGLAKFAHAYPKELSGGMQQRACLARALVLNPHILLMDEPFSALDDLARDKLGHELSKITRELCATVVFVTHSISEAVMLSDRVIVLSKRPGRIKASLQIALPNRTATTKNTKKFMEYVACIHKEMNS